MNRKEYIEKLKSQLDRTNNEIDSMEARFDSAEADARKKFQEQLTEAKAQRDAAENKLRKVRDAGEDAWEDLRGDAEQTWKALTSSVNYFKSHSNRTSSGRVMPVQPRGETEGSLKRLTGRAVMTDIQLAIEPG
jgi:chromosome segregation ATPase